MKQNRVTGKETLAGSLALGAGMCMVVTLLLTAVSAALVSAGTLQESATGYIAMIILFLGALAGAAAGGSKRQEKRLYVCLLIAAVYLGMLLALTAAFFGGQYRGVGVASLVLLSGAFVGAMAGQGKGRRANLRRSEIKRR